MTLLYFSKLRDLTGRDSEQIPMTTSLSEDGLWDLLEARHPGIGKSRNYVRIARNQVYLEPNSMLEPNDEVALIPPVSGG